jgi:predicted histidine transporter YuiF (NhaC family)
LLAVNFGISWFNANTVGRIWSESKQIGGGARVLAVAGYVMAIAGFTMVYSVIIIAIIAALGNAGGYFTPEQLQLLIGLSSDLTYVLIVLAVIPTGIIIWINSLISFWKHKSLRSGGIAAWNSFAMVSNVISASRNLPSAFGRIFSSLKNQRGNGAIILLALVVVACAVLGGYFTASAIVKKADRKYDLFSKVGMGKLASA